MKQKTAVDDDSPVRPLGDQPVTAERADIEPLALEACRFEVDSLIAGYTAFLLQEPIPDAKAQREKRLAMANEFKRLAVRLHPDQMQEMQRYLDLKIEQLEMAHAMTGTRSSTYALLTETPGAVLAAGIDTVGRTAIAVQQPLVNTVDAGGELVARTTTSLAERGAQIVEGVERPAVRVIDSATGVIAQGTSRVTGRLAEAAYDATERIKDPLLRTVGNVTEFAVGTVVEMLKGILRGLMRFGR